MRITPAVFVMVLLGAGVAGREAVASRPADDPAAERSVENRPAEGQSHIQSRDRKGVVDLAAPPPPDGRGSENTRERPNIVLILADDLGWNSVGYHGGPIRTPHIDRLARQGVALERFYVSPMCSPTRAGMLTGRYPMRFGMARSVVRPWARYGLPPEETTLPELLADAGYHHRGIFGKWHLGHLDPKWHPLSQGFTHFTGLYNGAADYWTRKREGEIDWHVDYTPQQPPGYTTDLIVEAACRFIREHAGDGPLFCYVPFTAPHDPFQAPDAYIARYAHLDDNAADDRPSDLQRLAAMTACMDDGIGKIMTALDEAGLTGNTLVWFISDNGGVTRIPGVNHPLRNGKLTVYEGGVRVPSAVWWPGAIEGGRQISEPMINLDVLPTLLHAARNTAVKGEVPASKHEARQAGSLSHTETRPAGSLSHTETRPAGSLSHTEIRPAGSRSHTETRPAGSLSHTVIRPAGSRSHTDSEADCKPIDGVNVLDVLTGKSETLPPRDLYFFTGQSGIENEQAAITSADGWKLVVIGPDIRWPAGFRTPAHRVELFHLTTDSLEKTDVSEDHPDRVAELGRQLIAFRRSEPKECVLPINRPARGFKPPRHWENAPASRP